MSVYGYTRVSTDAQSDPEGSLATQRTRILNYVAYKGLPGLTSLFSDPAVSGGTPLAERDDGGALMRSVVEGDHVVIASLDRAWRSALDCLGTVRRFHDQGVTLHLIHPAIDFSTPIGMVMLTIFAAFAEWERAVISERTKQGIKNHREHHDGAWGPRPYGNTPEEAQTLRTIATLRNAGLGWAAIALHLNTHGIPPRVAQAWTQDTVRRASQKGPEVKS